MICRRFARSNGREPVEICCSLISDVLNIAALRTTPRNRNLIIEFNSTQATIDRRNMY